MGAFGSLVSAVQTKVDKSRSGGDVAGQVKMFFAEAMEGIRSGAGKVPEFFKHYPEIIAGQVTEAQMLENTDLIMDQLQADGRRALPEEVRANIINAIRDAKIQSLEKDGYVNPLDKTVIQLQASALKAKVRNYLLSARMSHRGDVGGALDVVEDRLIEGITQEHGRNYDTWMRASQAAIWAVAELRQQQLVKQ